MNWVPVAAAFSLGLMGSAHCVAMCGGASVWAAGGAGRARQVLGFQTGRLAGYAAAGGLIATFSAALHALSSAASVFRPFWTMLNVGVFVLGMLLLVTARQPAVLDDWGLRASRAWRRRWSGNKEGEPVVWHRGGEAVATPGLSRALASGFLWALVPCGLLYSAFMLAAFSGSAATGSVTMAAFAFSSGLPLALAQMGATRWLRGGKDGGEARNRWGVRLAGAALCLTAAHAVAVQLFGPAVNDLFCLPH